VTIITYCSINVHYYYHHICIFTCPNLHNFKMTTFSTVLVGGPHYRNISRALNGTDSMTTPPIYMTHFPDRHTLDFNFYIHLAEYVMYCHSFNILGISFGQVHSILKDYLNRCWIATKFVIHTTHSVFSVQELLAKNKMNVIPQTLCSPHSVPRNFFSQTSQWC
jgi:hypothetical protein